MADRRLGQNSFQGLGWAERTLDCHREGESGLLAEVDGPGKASRDLRDKGSANRGGCATGVRLEGTTDQGDQDHARLWVPSVLGSYRPRGNAGEHVAP